MTTGADVTTAVAFDRMRQLPGFRECGRDQYEARCPAHDDRRASLSIGVGDDGQILLDCKAGCETESVLGALGLQMRNLFPHNGNGNHGHSGKTIVSTYNYPTADGVLSYQVVRFVPKDFRQRRPDGNGEWIWNMKGLKRLPYRLPELAGAGDVFIVEGEKDVDNLLKIGLTATCNSGGAGNWTEDLAQYFTKDQHIVILPDNDEPGRKHAEQVARSLSGQVASIKVLDLAGLRDKEDISDWLCGRDPQKASEELCRLVDAAAEWKTSVEDAKPQKAAGFQPPMHWEILDVAEVEKWQCTPLEWIIEHIVAKGNLVFVAADSQCGKTLLALYIVLKILTGGLLFDRFRIYPVKRVLYLLLEDPSRRAKQRILDMRQKIRVKLGQFMVYVAPGFSLVDDAHMAWLKQFIIEGQFDFVVLDTYQKATPGISSFDDTTQGPILHRLANLTRKANVTLWIHDHYRKEGGGKKRRELDLNSLKGTGGKPQNADAFILMERHGDRINVLVSSKDSDQKPRFTLRVSPEGSDEEKFQWAGDLEDASNDMKATGRMNRMAVYKAVKTIWTSKSEVKAVTCLADSTVNDHLAALCKDGKIQKTGTNRSTRYRRPSDGKTSLFRAVE
jgi:5S rRNA maturation endonuclease (ribonuclease M5)